MSEQEIITINFLLDVMVDGKLTSREIKSLGIHKGVSIVEFTETILDLEKIDIEKFVQSNLHVETTDKNIEDRSFRWDIETYGDINENWDLHHYFASFTDPHDIPLVHFTVELKGK